ncbi:hypothetical protein EWM64_g5059 [Hericium alpestre]|uniref:Uncharacterized protein n=1 Tax=Hericium alpestre TaxID=135208 RepID=A0A4Y9ZVV5_9AGAM|nr:hypothetical protein EWM64_g5059 [Hericium alpestre]
MACHHIYTDQLRALNSGHALWEPNPNDSSQQVNVGDVGYVLYGGFHRLFNIHLPAGHPRQGKNLPEYFEILELSLEHVYRRVLHPGPYRSQSVVSLNVEAPFAVAMPGGQVSLEFSCSRKRGAVLVLPDKANRTDTRNRGTYKTYLRTHCDRWFALTEMLGLGLHQEDIILVTGCDKTTSWATAAFVNREIQGRISLKDNNAQYNWGPDADDAPPQVEPARMMGGDALTATSEGRLDLQMPINTKYNQCVFVRGYRGKSRGRFLPMKMKAEATPIPGPSRSEDNIDPDGHGLTSSPVLVDLNDDGMEESHLQNMEAQTDSDDEHTDMLLPILDYVLDNSDVDFAIVHDDDLKPYVEASSTWLDVAARLKENGPSVVKAADDITYDTVLFAKAPKSVPVTRIFNLISLRRQKICVSQVFSIFISQLRLPRFYPGTGCSIDTSHVYPPIIISAPNPGYSGYGAASRPVSPSYPRLQSPSGIHERHTVPAYYHDVIDMTDAELRAWVGVSHKGMAQATKSARELLLHDTEREPHALMADQFMQQHVAALSRILYTRGIAEETLIPRAMMIHMMMKDGDGISMEKQLVYLEGLIDALEGAKQSGQVLVLPNFASKMDEAGIKVSAEELEREKDYPATLLKLALHSPFDAPAKTSGAISSIIGTLFPDLPPTQAKDSMSSSAPAFTVSFKDLFTAGIHVSVTYCLDEHLKTIGDTVRVFHLSPAVVSALRSYRGNRLAIALGIEDLGDEILASWKALLEGYRSLDFIECKNIFRDDLETDMGRVHQLENVIRFSKSVAPSIFAERERRLKTMIQSRREWHNVVMNDLDNLRRNNPQLFYGALVGIIAFGLMFLQALWFMLGILAVLSG